MLSYFLNTPPLATTLKMPAEAHLFIGIACVKKFDVTTVTVCDARVSCLSTSPCSARNRSDGSQPRPSRSGREAIEDRSPQIGFVPGGCSNVMAVTEPRGKCEKMCFQRCEITHSSRALALYRTADKQ